MTDTGPDETEQRVASAFFRAQCEFVMGAVSLNDIPPANLPEVAFIGRSNVGKSSLLNALVGRKALARTSNTPGRTQQLNFFRLGDAAMLVDLPGYGYAKASKTEIAKWNALIRDYLRGRASLTRVCVLIDSRHGLKDSDREMMEMLDNHAVSYQLVLTKQDKIKKVEEEAVIASTLAALAKRPAAYPGVVMTSAAKGDGIAALHYQLYQLILRTQSSS